MLRHAVGQQKPTALLAHIYTADSTRIFKIRSVFFCFFLISKNQNWEYFGLKTQLVEQTSTAHFAGDTVYEEKPFYWFRKTTG